MTGSPSVFGSEMAKWKAEQASPWATLKYDLVRANLAKHLGASGGRVLDAGGGNGLDSIPLARQGFTVDIVDTSPEMLAEAAANAAAANVAERVTVHQADVADSPALFGGQLFDVVLCHNVMQYVADLPAVLSGLAGLLKSGGVLSLVSVNRYSIPYKTLFFQDNLEQAIEQIGARSVKAYLFDVTMRCYAVEEARSLVEQAGLVVEADYGIRCVSDYWGDNEQKADPSVFAQVERLEAALTDKHPYKLLARFFQVLARQP